MIGGSGYILNVSGIINTNLYAGIQSAVSGNVSFWNDPELVYKLIIDPTLPRKHTIKDLITSSIVAGKFDNFRAEIEAITLGTFDYWDLIDQMFPSLGEEERKALKFLSVSEIDWDGFKVRKNEGPSRNITIKYKKEYTDWSEMAMTGYIPASGQINNVNHSVLSSYTNP